MRAALLAGVRPLHLAARRGHLRRVRAAPRDVARPREAVVRRAAAHRPAAAAAPRPALKECLIPVLVEDEGIGGVIAMDVGRTSQQDW